MSAPLSPLSRGRCLFQMILPPPHLSPCSLPLFSSPAFISLHILLLVHPFLEFYSCFLGLGVFFGLNFCAFFSFCFVSFLKPFLYGIFPCFFFSSRLSLHILFTYLFFLASTPPPPPSFYFISLTLSLFSSVLAPFLRISHHFAILTSILRLSQLFLLSFPRLHFSPLTFFFSSLP